MRTALVAALGAVAIAAVAIGVYVIGGDAVHAPKPAAPSGSAAGGAETRQAAPDIAFADRTGQPVKLADFHGRTVLLNFWATWCAPCVEELPALDRLQAKLGGERFVVIALNVDRDGEEKAAPFFGEHGIAHLEPYTDQPMKSWRAFRLVGLPTTVLIDADGKEVQRFSGAAVWDEGERYELIEDFVEGGGR